MTEGIKRLGKGEMVNWKGGLPGVKRGAKRAFKRKENVEILNVMSRKDLFGVFIPFTRDASNAFLSSRVV